MKRTMAGRGRFLAVFFFTLWAVPVWLEAQSLDDTAAPGDYDWETYRIYKEPEVTSLSAETDIIIQSATVISNGVKLEIGYPADFTNRLEIYATTNLSEYDWSLAATNLATTGTNAIFWTDVGTPNYFHRFYAAGNADLDRDGDGLIDGREKYLYGSSLGERDSDGDGLVDGYSGVVGTDAYAAGARTNGGAYVEGELTWLTEALNGDTDDDGMGDGWEVSNGHDPLDPNDPPNVSGSIFYAGCQTGTVWVVAVTNESSWSTNLCQVLGEPGLYRFVNLPGTSYWIRAFRDSNGNASNDSWEAAADYASNPVDLNANVTGIDITLVDPDYDTDGLPDWWELEYGLDPDYGGEDAPGAWWKLDELTGTNVADSTSASNQGWQCNMASNSWGMGVVGNALAFDGTNDYVQFNDNTSLKPGYVSVGLWAKPNVTLTNGVAVFFSKKPAGTNAGYELLYEQGQLTFRVCASGAQSVQYACVFTNGQWRHIAGTYGGQALRLYVDGILRAETNFDWGPSFGYVDQDATKPRLGATTGATPSNYWAGLMDDVRVHGAEWSSNQVVATWQLGADPDHDGLATVAEYGLGTDPTDSDTDGDGLKDGEEIVTFHTNPLDGDTDDDAIPDGNDILVTLFTPSPNACFSTNWVPVEGEVVFTGAECRIWVNSLLVPVVTNDPVRSFRTTVPFQANGSNEVSVMACGFLGETMVNAYSNVPVGIEAYPPNLTILAPADERMVEGRNVHVAVMTDSESAVTVNGISAMRDGYMNYAWVPLIPGTNTIVAESTNAHGQAGSDAVTIFCDVPPDTPWVPVADQDMDGVLDANDPAPGDPSIKSIIRVTAPVNGITLWLKE